MAKWFAVHGTSVLRSCEAPNKVSAATRLQLQSGERCVSAASWQLDTDAVALVPRGRCGTCHVRYVIGSDVECSFCQRARTQQDEGVPPLPSFQSHASLDGKPMDTGTRERIVASRRRTS